jgi:hypothetical protein
MNDSADGAGASFRRGGLLWVLASVQTFLIARDYGVDPPASPLFLIVLAVAGLWAAETLRARRGGEGLRSAFGRGTVLAGVAVLAFLASCLVDGYLAAEESRLAHVPGLSLLGSWGLRLAGLTAHSADSTLYLVHPDGLLGVTPSFEKCAVRPIVAWLVILAAVAWLESGRRSVRLVVLGSVLAALSIVGWFCYGLCHVAEIDNILRANYPSAIRHLWNPWYLSVFLALLTAAFVRLSRRIRRSRGVRAGVPEVRAGAPGPALLACLLLSFSCVLHLGFVDPGRPREGRVLIDDLHSGSWETSARMMTPDWFGDYSTYNYNALAQHLGRYFPVRVNTRRRLSRELLSDVDVLILKTPTVPFDPDEIAAVEDFIQEGGGALLIGDHTNLLWMDGHLNSVARRSGLSFRYDMIATADRGSFNEYRKSVLEPVHPVLEGVSEFEWMTSCSIDPGPGGRIVMAVPNGIRHPNDYGGSSYFGPMGHDPLMEVGPQVLMAEAPMGRGMILAFADSTPFSSFSYYMRGHDQVLLNAVSRLNRSRLLGEWPGVLAGAGALLAALILGWSTAGGAWERAPLLVLCAVAGWGGGLAFVDSLNRASFRCPDPVATPPVITFLEGGGFCAFPPTLGGSGDVPPEAIFDTLYCLPTKLGWEPRLSQDKRGAFRENPAAVVLINPVLSETTETLEAARRYVEEGGTLILLDRVQHAGSGARKDFLDTLGLDLHVDVDRTSRVPRWHSGSMAPFFRDEPTGFEVWIARVGAGRVVFVAESDYLSRAGIGHNFSFPSAIQERRRFLFTDLLSRRLHLGRAEPPTYAPADPGSEPFLERNTR